MIDEHDYEHFTLLYRRYASIYDQGTVHERELAFMDFYESVGMMLKKHDDESLELKKWNDEQFEKMKLEEERIRE